MKKEIILVTEKDFKEFDFSIRRKGQYFEFNDVVYHFVFRERIDGDGEWHRVIIQRESDKKFFEYSWGEYRDRYFFEPDFTEVFEEKQIMTIYK